MIAGSPASNPKEFALIYQKLERKRLRFNSSTTYINLSELVQLGPDFQSDRFFMLTVDTVSGIYEKELQNIVRRFKNIQGLRLDNYPTLTNIGLQILTSLPHLVILDLACISAFKDRSIPSQITDFGLQHIASLEKLQTLDISGLKITDLTLKEIGKLSNLKNLFLRSCHHITDRGVMNLAQLKSLESLDLIDCVRTTQSGWRALFEVAEFSLKYFNGTCFQ